MCLKIQLSIGIVNINVATSVYHSTSIILQAALCGLIAHTIIYTEENILTSY